MRSVALNSFVVMIIAACVGIGLTDLSWAGARGVPGPLAGVGLPAWIAAAGGYWLYRKLRDRNRSD